MAVSIRLSAEQSRAVFYQEDGWGTMQYRVKPAIEQWAKKKDLWMPMGYIGFNDFPHRIELPTDQAAVEFKLMFL